MAKTPKKVITSHIVVWVTVPTEFVGQTTAYKLGYYHGYEGLKTRQSSSFIHKPTATAYSVGVMAGCVARAKGARQ